MSKNTFLKVSDLSDSNGQENKSSTPPWLPFSNNRTHMKMQIESQRFHRDIWIRFKCFWMDLYQHLHFPLLWVLKKKYQNSGYNCCPMGILCGRRLNLCVRNGVADDDDGDGFSAVLPLCSSTPYTFFGWHSQGIRDQLKSVDQSVLQKHTDVAQHATCQKHTFLDQKSTTGKWTTCRKLTILGSIL